MRELAGGVVAEARGHPVRGPGEHPPLVVALEDGDAPGALAPGLLPGQVAVLPGPGDVQAGGVRAHRSADEVPLHADTARARPCAGVGDQGGEPPLGVVLVGGAHAVGACHGGAAPRLVVGPGGALGPHPGLGQEAAGVPHLPRGTGRGAVLAGTGGRPGAHAHLAPGHVVEHAPTGPPRAACGGQDLGDHAPGRVTLPQDRLTGGLQAAGEAPGGVVGQAGDAPQRVRDRDHPPHAVVLVAGHPARRIHLGHHAPVAVVLQGGQAPQGVDDPDELARGVVAEAARPELGVLGAHHPPRPVVGEVARPRTGLPPADRPAAGVELRGDALTGGPALTGETGVGVVGDLVAGPRRGDRGTPASQRIVLVAVGVPTRQGHVDEAPGGVIGVRRRGPGHVSGGQDPAAPVVGDVLTRASGGAQPDRPPQAVVGGLPGPERVAQEARSTALLPGDVTGGAHGVRGGADPPLGVVPDAPPAPARVTHAGQA